MRRGQSPSSPVVKFDIRDDICVAVGGFKHGQVVMYAGTKYAVVGVHQSYEDDLFRRSNFQTDSCALPTFLGWWPDEAIIAIVLLNKIQLPTATI